MSIPKIETGLKSRRHDLKRSRQSGRVQIEAAGDPNTDDMQTFGMKRPILSNATAQCRNNLGSDGAIFTPRLSSGWIVSIFVAHRQVKDLSRAGAVDQSLFRVGEKRVGIIDQIEIYQISGVHA